MVAYWRREQFLKLQHYSISLIADNNAGLLPDRMSNSEGSITYVSSHLRNIVVNSHVRFHVASNNSCHFARTIS